MDSCALPLRPMDSLVDDRTARPRAAWPKA